VDNNLLIDKFKALGYSLNDNQINQFNKYYEMLIEKNKVMNLTAITDYRDVVIKHFIDSCSIIKILNDNNEIIRNTDTLSLLDMGTGAGFPGIPLKIIFPNLRVTLMDSLNKRIKFLNEVIVELGLDNCNAIHCRAEEFARKTEYREQFNIVVSRAVAKLSTLSEFCIPYLSVNGYFIPYKSSNASQEIEDADNAIKTLGCKLIDIKEVKLPDDEDIIRLMPIIKKVKNTPSKYPRVGCKAEKNPL
jgi:16S rRNA (guanine527-N7)-methyltransferase